MCKKDGTNVYLPAIGTVPIIAICGKWRYSSLWKAPQQHSGELITCCLRPLPHTWDAFRVSEIFYTESCVQRYSGLLSACASHEPFSFIFLITGGGLLSEQQGLKFKFVQVLNRLMFLKSFMLSDIRGLA